MAALARDAEALGVLPNQDAVQHLSREVLHLVRSRKYSPHYEESHVRGTEGERWFPYPWANMQ